MESRHIALAVASSLALMLASQPANADPEKSGPQARSDSAANTCVDDCLAKGYEWAKANAVTNDDQCDVKSDDFEHGCNNYINDQEAAAKAGHEATEDAAKDSHEATEDAAKASHEATEQAADANKEAAESTEKAADEASEGEAPEAEEPAKPPGN